MTPYLIDKMQRQRWGVYLYDVGLWVNDEQQAQVVYGLFCCARGCVRQLRSSAVGFRDDATPWHLADQRAPTARRQSASERSREVNRKISRKFI